MSLAAYLDKGASLGLNAPCLTLGGKSWTYGQVVDLSRAVARALRRAGVQPGDKVGILSANDPAAFASVFGIARAGAVWCPIASCEGAAEKRELLDLFDCTVLLYQSRFAAQVMEIADELPQLTTLVEFGRDFASWTAKAAWDLFVEAGSPDGVVAIMGTGRTRGVQLTDRNFETMTAITLMSYPFDSRPVYLALAPLTKAAGLLCFPVMAHGGEIVMMPEPDIGEFLRLIERHHVTHTFLPPTLIYQLLRHPKLDTTELGSLQCFWYDAAAMSLARLEEALTRIGPVMAQLFGQPEAPITVSTMAPSQHFTVDGAIDNERLSSAGRPSPLVTVAIMDDKGRLLEPGERGEIVVRGSLVMAGYYKNPEATAKVSAHGWHHTGDIGYLDDENFLHLAGY